MNKTDESGDMIAIRGVFESWYRAMEDGDVSGVISLVTKDVFVKPPDAAPLEGDDALREALGAFLETYSETVDYDIQEIQVSGSLAFALVLERAEVKPKSGGDVSSVNGMHLTILRRQPGGEWLIARDISSLIGRA